jgi:TRAP-type mannitol/chloroaromatic compound transport system substrate-binding protein
MVAGLSPMEMMLWVLQGGGLDLCREMFAQSNVYIYPNITHTPEIFLSSNKPLNTVGDLKGLKIRTAGDDGAIFTRLGASTVNVPPGEVYESMKRGVIDAFQIGSPSIDWSYGMQEVTKYVYLSPVRQPCELFILLIMGDSWAKLTPDLQKIVQACSLEEAWTHLSIQATLDIGAAVKYVDYGVKVAPASKEIEDAVIREAEAFYKELSAKDPFYAKVVDSQLNFRKTFRATFPRGL